MLFFLFLLSALSSSSSTPLASSSTSGGSIPIVLPERQAPECVNNIAPQRTIQNIVLSSLATVFACTWVAVHPNLPGPYDSGRTKLKRKVVTMVYALLAPEFMALWALRQRLAAGRIAYEFNRTQGISCAVPGNLFKASWVEIRSTVVEWWRGSDRTAPNVWTLTHGFFVQAGGFILCDGKELQQVLTFSDLQAMIKKGRLEPPDITERDINDRSKEDLLTKIIVVVQTSWFVFQCLARWSMQVQLTDLEVATLAFAALNIVTYGLWLKKPQNIEVAVRLQLRPVADESNGETGEEPQTENTEKEVKAERARARKCTVERALPMKAMSNEWAGWLIEVPSMLLLAVRRPFHKMTTDDDRIVRRGSLRMPMFYADRWEVKDYFPIWAITMLFGVFHLIPWSSSFPSDTELWLWRSSALIIVIQPIWLALYVSPFGFCCYNIKVWNLYFYSLPLYLLARLTLLVLAFATLRDLPPGAYTDVGWTAFVPHL